MVLSVGKKEKEIMADKGLPPKSPLMQIRRVAHNRKHQYSSPWIDVEGSTLTDAMMVHLRSTSESHPMARNTDVDKLEGGLAHLDKGHLKTTADKTGPPPSLDHNNSSSEGEVVTGSSSKDDVVEDEKSACKINGGSDSNMDPRRVKRWASLLSLNYLTKINCTFVEKMIMWSSHWVRILGCETLS